MSLVELQSVQVTLTVCTLFKNYSFRHKENKLQRRDARDGRWYTKSQFIEYYGDETAWNDALLHTYQHSSNE